MIFNDVKLLNVIVILLAILVFVIYNKCRKSVEGMASSTATSSIDIEAIENLASMYQDGTLKVTNIEASGNITSGGELSATGNITSEGELSADMRFYSLRMKIGDNQNKEIKIADATLSGDKWVCFIGGMNLDWNNTDPGRIEAFCFVKDNKWYLRSEVESATDSGEYNIICMPSKCFSDTNNNRLYY